MKFSFPHNSVFASSIRFQQHQQQRWKSTSSKKSKSEVPTITKQELQNLIGQNKGDYVLIDVRGISSLSLSFKHTLSLSLSLLFKNLQLFCL
jgi:hypothetical protein